MSEIKTQASVSGFIVGDARLQHDKNGNPWLTVRVGQEQFAAAPGGGFEQLDNHYFNLVQFGKAAERTFAQFKPGDRFLAEGELRPFEFTNKDNETIAGTDFLVKKVGHDTAWTRYVVDRSPRNGAERETPAAEQSLQQEAPDAPDTEPSHPASSSSRSPRSKKLATFPGPGESASADREPVGADVPF